MPRATNAPASRARRKRMIKAAKGYRGRRSKLFRYAKDAVVHGLVYAFAHRKQKKRNYRGLWIQRINAASRPLGLTYSRFTEGLQKANVKLDRKTIADIAVSDPAAFSKLVDLAKKNLKVAA